MVATCWEDGWRSEAVNLLQEQQALYHGDAHSRSGKCWAVTVRVAAVSQTYFMPAILCDENNWQPGMASSFFFSSLFRTAVTLILMLKSTFCPIPRKLPRGKLRLLEKPATQLTMKWYAPACLTSVGSGRDWYRLDTDRQMLRQLEVLNFVLAFENVGNQLRLFFPAFYTLCVV